MEVNNSLTAGALSDGNIRVVVNQVIVAVFLYINSLLIATFFTKDCFYTSMRYIFFVTTLMSDCIFLIISDLQLVMYYFQVSIQVWLCLILYCVVALCHVLTPCTLTAMTLERYVAICMPLRHGELSSVHRTLLIILIMNGLSSFPCMVFISIFCASASLPLFTEQHVCTVELFIVHSWQRNLRAAIDQVYFFIMGSIIVFSYLKIMPVAKAASGENKKSTWKGLRTVMLHGFQLLLCLIQLWIPFIEAAVIKIDIKLFIEVRYFTYIIFILAPRCLSPLIYGLRDEMFSQALKNNVFCGIFKKSAVRQMTTTKVLPMKLE